MIPLTRSVKGALGMLREGTSLVNSSIMQENLRVDCNIQRAQAQVFNWDWTATLFLRPTLDRQSFLSGRFLWQTEKKVL